MKNQVKKYKAFGRQKVTVFVLGKLQLQIKIRRCINEFDLVKNQIN